MKASRDTRLLRRHTPMGLGVLLPGQWCDLIALSGEYRHQPRMYEQLLSSNRFFAQDSRVDESMKSAGRQLSRSESALDEVADSAVWLFENDIQQVSIVQCREGVL